MRSLPGFLCLCSLGCPLAPALLGADATAVVPVQETMSKAQNDARMAWWRAARFGMFIHWGIYALPGYPVGPLKQKPAGGGGEWIMNFGQIPVQVYENQGPLFNPTQFNADAWVTLARMAGMKYMIITAKHHDGFAMFKTQVDPFNICDATPFRRDPLKELSVAAAMQGIKLGFYYSHNKDWTAKGGGDNPRPWDSAQVGDYDTYFHTKALPQLTELLTNYQPSPAVLFFDGGGNQPDTPEVVSLLNKHPNVIWNDRLGGGYHDDMDTPEGVIPARKPGRDWETCMTMNDGWAYDASDKHYKSAETLLHNLIDIVSKGGNYLLNVGPTDTGVIPEGEAAPLRVIGAWLDTNGDAIYGTSAGPFNRPPPWGRGTQKPGKLYLSVFSWPVDGTLAVPLSSPVSRAYLLSAPGKALPFIATAEEVTVLLPAQAPDPLASVVVLEVPQPPVASDIATEQRPDGRIVLSPETARLEGDMSMANDAPACLEGWNNPKDVPRWTMRVTKPGRFTVSVDYACPGGPVGSQIAVGVGGKSLLIALPPSKDWSDWKLAVGGTIDIDTTGPVEFTATGTKIDGRRICNLRSVTLTPAP